MTSWGATTLLERLRHLLPLLVEHEAVREHDVVGSAAAGAAAFQQRGVEPAAMLVGAFQVHDGIGAAVALADDAGELGKVHRVFQREGMRGGGVEPHVADVVDLLPFGGAVVVAEEAFGGTRLVPGADAFFLQRGINALVDALVLQHLVGAVGIVLDEDRDRHAPGALARQHPVGLGLDHAGDAVLAGGRYPLRLADGAQRELTEREAIDGCPASEASLRGGGGAIPDRRPVSVAHALSGRRPRPASRASTG